MSHKKYWIMTLLLLATSSFLGYQVWGIVVHREASKMRAEINPFFAYKDSSQYLIFHTQNQMDKVPKLAQWKKVVDPLIRGLEQELGPWTYPWPLHAYIFEDFGVYQDFATKVLQLNHVPTGGVYLPRYRAFFIHEEAGLSVFAHELLHPLLDDAYGELPHWADEGLPAYGEVFDYKEYLGEWMVFLGGDHPYRSKGLEVQIKNKAIALDQILCCSSTTSEKRLVATFLHHHAKVPDYMNLLRKKQTRGYSSYLEAVFDKPLPEIVPLWNRHLDSIARGIARYEPRQNELPHSLRKGI